MITISPSLIAVYGFCFTVISALIGIGIFWGSMKTQIASILQAIERLEKKQDKYNNLQERMVKVEARAASNTHRLDNLEA